MVDDSIGGAVYAQRTMSRRRRRSAPSFALDALEPRCLLAAISINAGQVIRAVNPQVIATNLAWWGGDLGDARTRQLAQAAGLTLYRFPGGSASDSFHFTDAAPYNGYNTVPSFAKFIQAENAAGIATIDYGSGSPQEGAALLAYLNGSAGSAVSIGDGQIWNSATSTWVQRDWKTAGYWAGLRSAAPLATDDGLNFLRINHPAPFAIHYWEVGNEEYGSWETDHRGAGGDAGKPHDPATYVAFAKQFATFTATIDPSISIGIDSGSISLDNNWTGNVLAQGVVQGFTPGFISDHVYMQAPGSENDSTLLLHTVSDPNTQGAGSPFKWSQRAAGYRNLLNQKLGAAVAANVQLLNTEFNSVYSNPGKQTTSLVNGLFVADSIGSILQTEYNASVHWDLRNGFDTGNNNAASLYGWRQGGDYGLLGSFGGTAPATGGYVPYPTYFAEQLLSKMLHAGDTVVKATSSDIDLAAYAVRQANGHLDLLVINKSATADLNGAFMLSGFLPAPQAQFYQYGKAQDTAQMLTTDGHAALASFSASIAPSGSSFGYTFPSYSMTVIDLAPAAQVVARNVFYNNSVYDGNNAAAGAADDGAIDPGKIALLPGQAATPANYTGYVRGLNGVMLDVARLGNRAALTAADFSFRLGATGDPSSWPAAPVPSVTVRAGAGFAGSDRIELIWSDNAIQNAWLQVTVKADANTGLNAPDVFYFGNLVGDTANDFGDPAARVSAADLADIRIASVAPVSVATAADVNKDGVVNGTDTFVVRANLTHSLPLFAAPALPAVASQAIAVAGTAKTQAALASQRRRGGFFGRTERLDDPVFSPPPPPQP
jgi:alpha-L-arabinofuranosidase